MTKVEILLFINSKYEKSLNEIKKKAIDNVLTFDKWVNIETPKRNEQLTSIINGMEPYMLECLEAIAIFDNKKVLEDLNYYFETYTKIALGENKTSLNVKFFYFDSIMLYNRIKLFKKSGISKNNFNRDLKKINSTLKELQKYSSKKIELDLIPIHPTDAINDFYDNYVSLNSTHFSLVDIINSIIEPLKEQYKKKPPYTKNSSVKEIKEKAQQELFKREGLLPKNLK